MSSILTNNGAMVALQTLKSINNDLGDVQSQISTGKKVNSASDNAAIWAVSKVMESDQSSFKQIGDQLSLGEATVAVASNASEQMVSLLTEMQDLAIQASGDNVDHAKIQNDITAKHAQIDSIIGGAQFNGVNLLATDVDGAGSTGIDVISSIDRVGAAAPTVSTIAVAGVDFEGSLTTANAGLTAITDGATARTAITEIEALLQTAVNGAAALGSSQSRLSDQGEFVSKLADSLSSGIGALVDADMEETSARLQALQVQQQLGAQALSIANQAPQQLLSLFR
ncbi:flagellin N-terminal helical domain-containing protein [Shimia sp. Alg240-R146]|uniref:flagellin N-terminal helical domain-containing protein n=1 Tax=Shimia sp. Alg240-R146 TaxID=2993449 RepID=UPI0022E93548|nr:flagellin [Shimia sp. Alg240-R146]